MSDEMVLAIDTSTRYGGTGLWRDGNLVASFSWRSAHNHTAELMPALDRVLGLAGVKIGELSAIGVALGPGGFSALRVGISVAKGLALGTGVPLLGVGTLEIEAYPYAATGLVLCSVLEAGREDVATALFQMSGSSWLKLRDEDISTLERLVEDVPEGAFICGEGAIARYKFLKEQLGSRMLINELHSPATRLEALATLATERFNRGDVDDAATLQPRYLRRPSIGPSKVHHPVKR